MLKLTCLALVLASCAVANAQIFHSCEIMQLVCGSMLDPGSNLMNTTSQYSITPSTYRASPNDIISVALRGNIDFKGIFMQGRRDNKGEDHTPLGHFVPPEPDVEPTVLICDCPPGEENAALYINPFQPLREVIVQYIVPDNEPKVFFRASMSWNGTTFWHVHSDPLIIN